MSHFHIFSTLLADELSAGQHLFVLLQDEQAAIPKQDLPYLHELQTKKQAALEQLRQRATARQQFLSAHEYADFHALLMTLKQEQQQRIKKVWLQLGQQYKHNRDMADSLAQIVQQVQWRAQQQLQILCGKSEKTDVYGQDGRPQTHHNALGMVQA